LLPGHPNTTTARTGFVGAMTSRTARPGGTTSRWRFLAIRTVSTPGGRQRGQAVHDEQQRERHDREKAADRWPDAHAEVDREPIDGDRGLATLGAASIP
jgi:hypothetical protein